MASSLLLNIPGQTVPFSRRRWNTTPSGHRFAMHHGAVVTGWGEVPLDLVVDVDDLFVPANGFLVDGIAAWLSTGADEGKTLGIVDDRCYEMTVEAQDVRLLRDASSIWRKGVSGYSGTMTSGFGSIDALLLIGIPDGPLRIEDRPAMLMLSAGGSGYQTKAQRQR